MNFNGFHNGTATHFEHGMEVHIPQIIGRVGQLIFKDYARAWSFNVWNTGGNKLSTM